MRYSNLKSGKSKIVWIVALFVFLVGLILMVVGGYNYFTQVKQEPSSLPSSLEVVVTKGPISGASVSVYELNVNGEKGDLIKGPLTSDVSGNVSFDLPANLPKRLFIESRGGFYKSEGTGQTVQLKDTDTLTAVLPAGTKTAAVTPFTHMAAALVKTKIQGGEAPDEAVISANQEVAKRYGLKSILETIPASEGTLEEKQYGLLLAGFATLAKNLGVRSIDLSQALAEDWSDGITDGKEDGKAISINNGPALGSSASPSGLSQAADQFAKSGKAYGSKEASVVVSPKPAAATAADFRITTTALPAWVSGKQGSYTITAEGGSLPLNWSVKSGSLPNGFTLSKDGVISGAFSLPQGVTKKIFPQFTVEAKDQTGKTQSITLSVTVVPEAPQITTYNPPTLTVGESYDEIVATAISGLPPYTFSREASSGPMPFGMEITSSGSDAHLTGSPKAKGNFSFRVCVVDQASTEKCGNVVFVVNEAQAALPKEEPEDTEGCPSPFDGTWSGTFQQTGERWYMDDPVTNRAITHPYSFSFNVEFTAKCDWYHRDEGWASLIITHAVISHPFYGCQGGCGLEAKNMGGFSVEGNGDTWFSIEFPNGELTIGELKMNGNNSITTGAHEPDVYLRGGYEEDPFYDDEGAREGWPACQMFIGCNPSSVGAHYNVTFTKK